MAAPLILSQSRTDMAALIKKILPPLALLALIIAAFGRSLFHGFVWDDNLIILNNPVLRQITDWPDIFLSSFWQIGSTFHDTTRSFYRPVITLSYAFDYALWGTNPVGYHAHNLLLHFACILLAWRLAIRFLPAQPRQPADTERLQCRSVWSTGFSLSFLAAALFAVHPTHVENVCWISGRTDLYAALFFLAALLAYLKRLDLHGQRYSPLLLFSIGIFYALSLLSKEAALSFPLVLGAHYILFDRNNPSRRHESACVLFAVILVTAAYLGLRAITLGAPISLAGHLNLARRIASAPMVFCRYLALLLGLENVDPHHAALPLDSLFAVPNALYIPLALAYPALIAAALLLRKRETAFWLLWLPLTLLPVFNFGTFGDILYADRFLYLPSIAYSLLFVMALRRLRALAPLLKNAATILSAAYLLLLILLSNLHATYWKDDTSLFSHAVTTSPDSAYIHANLGFYHARNGHHQDALAAYARALQLDPASPRFYANAGYSLNELGRHADAYECLLQALELGDASTLTLNNLGVALQAQGRLDDASAFYRLSLQVEPTDAAHNNLGECLLAQGYTDAAIQRFRSAIALRPSPQAFHNLGLAYLKMGNTDDAHACFRNALDAATDVLPPSQIQIISNALSAAQDPAQN